MGWLTAATREVFSLFVDDVPYTAAILIWVGVGTLGLPRTAFDTGWDAVLLFLGFAVILVFSTGIAARAHGRDR